MRVLSGYGGIVLANNRPMTPRVIENIVDTQYIPCACSPFGKPYRVSRPRTSMTQPLVWTETAYDYLGRPTTITHAPVSGTTGNSGITQYDYALVGGSSPRQQTRVTDPAGRWKRQSLDAFGELREVYEPNPQGGAEWVANNAYNALGKLGQVSMPRVHPSTGAAVTQTRTFNYNLDGTLQSEVLPETGTTRYAYSNGKVLKKFDNANRATKWEYDATTQRLMTVRRLAAVANGTPDWQDGTEDVSLRTSYSYDAAGRVWTITSGMGPLASAAGTITETFGYTAAGQLATKQVATGWGTLTASWQYDSIGRVLRETYPSGKVKWYGYGLNGRHDVIADDASGESTFENRTDAVTGATIGWRTISGSAGYDAWGRMTSMSGPTVLTAGNPVQGTWNQGWSFNEAGQMTGYGLTENLGSINQTSTGITYDYGAVPAAGKVATATRQVTVNYAAAGNQSTSYLYDSVGRLTSASTPATASMPNGWTQGFVYDGFGNLVAKTAGGEAAGSAFDNRAAMTYPAVGGVVQDNAPYTYYDQESRLTFQMGERYGYDSSNRRILRMNDTITTWKAEVTFWAGRRMGTYRFSWDANTNSYILGGSSDDYVVGGRVVRPSDRVGSNLSEGRRYLPYGEEVTTTANNADKFATYHRDITGLDYADQRYYIPGAGRFMTADPYQASAGASDPGSWNRYSYVQGDPVNFNDVAGLASSSVVYDSGLTLSTTAFVAAAVDIGVAWWLQGVRHIGNVEPSKTPIMIAEDRMDAVSGAIERALKSESSHFTTDELDCIAGIESEWNPNVGGPQGRAGLFQFNKDNWDAWQKVSPKPYVGFDKASDPFTAAWVAVLSLEYRYQRKVAQGLDEAAAKHEAIGGFGEQDGRYANEVEKCAKELGAGHFSKAYSGIKAYHQWRRSQ